MAYRRITTWGLTLLFLTCPAAPALAVETATYTYDAMDRLAQVKYTDGTTVTYTYDKMGNRLTETVVAPTTDLAGEVARQLRLPAQFVFQFLIVGLGLLQLQFQVPQLNIEIRPLLLIFLLDLLGERQAACTDGMTIREAARKLIENKAGNRKVVLALREIAAGKIEYELPQRQVR